MKFEIVAAIVALASSQVSALPSFNPYNYAPVACKYSRLITLLPDLPSDSQGPDTRPTSTPQPRLTTAETDTETTTTMASTTTASTTMASITTVSTTTVNTTTANTTTASTTMASTVVAPRNTVVAPRNTVVAPRNTVVEVERLPDTRQVMRRLDTQEDRLVTNYLSRSPRVT